MLLLLVLLHKFNIFFREKSYLDVFFLFHSSEGSHDTALFSGSLHVDDSLIGGAAETEIEICICCYPFSIDQHLDSFHDVLGVGEVWDHVLIDEFIGES